MVEMRLFTLLCALACACPASDGSEAAPFYVDSGTTVSPAPGSVCAPFPSLELALTSTSSQTVTIVLHSETVLPEWTVQNAVTLLGNENTLEVRGVVSVHGSLALSHIELRSYISKAFVLQVKGALSIFNCTVRDFVSLPIHVLGQVYIAHSLFRENTRGVFSSLARGSNLTVTQSQFDHNAVNSGAVFFLYPLEGAEASQFFISDCVFQGNGVKGGSSVLALNDLLSAPTTTEQIVSFSHCSYKEHPVALFQLANKQLELVIEDCQFDSESQLITGQLLGANVSVSSVSVTQSEGPLFVLEMSGVLILTASNFTNIGNGPLIVITGSGESSALLCLTQVRVVNITNSNNVIYGNLINGRKVTIWLDHVRLVNFSSTVEDGIFFLIQTALFSRHFTAINGTTVSSIVGMILFSSLSMNDTYFEAVNSLGSMWFFIGCAANFHRIKYRNITGVFNPFAQYYMTNLMTMESGSDVLIDQLDIVLVNDGVPKLYVRSAVMRLSNSVFTGPLGFGILGADYGTIVIRNLTITTTTPCSRLVKRSPGSTFDVDHLVLKNLRVIDYVWTSSPGSAVHIQTMVLINVTSPSVIQGSRFEFIVEEMLIQNSTLKTVVSSAVSA